MNSRKHTLSVLWSIFITFTKISPITFGGGYAMIPQLEQELVKRKQWMKKEDISDLFVISQSVPGSIAMNAAIFTGYHLAGVTGAITAMFGMLLPTLLIILVLAALFLGFQDHHIVQKVFLGVRPAIVALILFAAYKIGKTAIIDKLTFFILSGTILLLLCTEIHPIDIIIIGGLIGILLLKFIKKKAV